MEPRKSGEEYVCKCNVKHWFGTCSTRFCRHCTTEEDVTKQAVSLHSEKNVSKGDVRSQDDLQQNYYKPTTSSKVEDTQPTGEWWEADLRRELNLKYDILGVWKQPNGNREQWIESDIAQIKELLLSDHEKVIKEVEGVIKDKIESMARNTQSTVLPAEDVIEHLMYVLAHLKSNLK